MREFVIQNEGHSIGCLLRDKLLLSSRFAACIVKHPQDENLVIKIDAEDPKSVILNAVSEMSCELDKVISVIKKSKFHDE